jgi:hypothetical protein
VGVSALGVLQTIEPTGTKPLLGEHFQGALVGLSLPVIKVVIINSLKGHYNAILKTVIA